jgi:hypothetical protein
VPSPTLKQKLGCWLHERWRAELVLRAPRLAARCGLGWQDLCNRRERLTADPATGGRICHWEDSSQLTVARVFPRVGAALLRRALEEWPLEFHFGRREAADTPPEISILIPIGGSERRPQFELALAAARAQQGIAFEIIVVEQSEAPQLEACVPGDVRHIHQPASSKQRGFNKSWALNRAAKEARGKNYLMLDADYLIPRNFAQECHRALQSLEGVRPGRLLFNLSERALRRLTTEPDMTAPLELDGIVANTPTPVALRAAAYWSLGGHDESYFGWGGEDNEFLERLRTRPISEGGWLPIVHAWHLPAPKKLNGDRNRELHAAITAAPVAERIRGLVARPTGGLTPQSAFS